MSKQVLKRMELQLDSWEKTKDDRRYFLQCYQLMTSNMLKAIEKQEFNDNVWVGQLLEHFSEYYFNALNKYEANTSAPFIWNEVFNKTTKSNPPIIQAMILGVNAHINYDLVLCLNDMLINEWKDLGPEQKEERYQDHDQVNQIIASTIDRVQDEVLEPENYVMKVIDFIFGRLDEYLLSRLITSWRKEVWEQALKLVECKEEDKRTVLDQIEKKAVKKMDILNLSI